MRLFITAFTILLAVSLTAQSDLPGQAAVVSVYGADVELDLTKCCFAAYGWHIALEVKTEDIGGLIFTEYNLAKQLFEAGISYEKEEQYYAIDDGRYLVVSSAENFEKVLSRYLVNVNSQNH
jgi:hypothetical protein